MKNIIIIFFFFFSINFAYALNKDNVLITGNKNIDKDVILSIINNLLDEDKIDTNKITKRLFETGNFKDISIEFENDLLKINLIENPVINEITFTGNERFKTDELFETFDLSNSLIFYNEKNISLFIDELKNLYFSFGYNQVDIDYEKSQFVDNLLNLNFTINEGKISKINKVYFKGNDSFNKKDLLGVIKSRERNYLLFFTSKNFKSYEVKNDTIKLINFYKENGFKNIKVDYQTEYISNKNKFNIYFYLTEGQKFFYNEVTLNVEDNILSESQLDNINIFFNKQKEKIYSKNKVFNLTTLKEEKKILTDYLFTQGLSFFDIKILEKSNNDLVDVMLNVSSTAPKYVKSINVLGNTRTLDKVIRREMTFDEGDSVTDFQIRESKKNLKSLDIFQKVEIEEEYIDASNVNINVNVEEKSTGDFQLGVAIGTLEGATFISSLKEKNISGTGRNVEFSINTSSANTLYKINVIEPYIFNQKLNFFYGINFSQKDFSDSSSYELDSFNTNLGIGYDLNNDLSHKVSIIYELKDYTITNQSTVADSIKKAEGANAEIKLENILNYNKLNSFIRPTKGNQIIYANVFSPPTNSDNGFLKNVVTLKKYYSLNRDNNVSIQTRIGNIFSLQDSEILTDDKFSLGGRWLRGFDAFGAGPRESANSYYGGNNLFVTKIDYRRSIFNSSDNPIDFNLFTDFGTVFDNKNDPANSEESIRSSYGLGFNFYSPIGPIGLSWGFPITDESYDKKRRFLFSIGNLN